MIEKESEFKINYAKIIENNFWNIENKAEQHKKT